MNINKKTMEVMIQAHKYLKEKENGSILVKYAEKEAYNNSIETDYRTIQYIVIKDSAYYGQGYHLYDYGRYVASFDIEYIQKLIDNEENYKRLKSNEKAKVNINKKSI